MLALLVVILLSLGVDLVAWRQAQRGALPARRMAHAPVVLVDDCDQWAQLEAGAGFREELVAFLADLEA